MPERALAPCWRRRLSNPPSPMLLHLELANRSIDDLPPSPLPHPWIPHEEEKKTKSTKKTLSLFLIDSPIIILFIIDQAGSSASLVVEGVHWPRRRLAAGRSCSSNSIESKAGREQNVHPAISQRQSHERRRSFHRRSHSRASSWLDISQIFLSSFLPRRHPYSPLLAPAPSAPRNEGLLRQAI